MTSVYFESWASKWVSDGSSMDLVGVDTDVVNIAFVDPSMKYVKGSNTFAGTGLQFSQDFGVVKAAIVYFKDKANGKVMLSVGGASYGNWAGFKADSIVALCNDLGVDGIDIDWESVNGIADDSLFGPIIDEVKSKWNGLISAAVWSVGAYENTTGSGYAGMNVKGLNSSGSKLNWINIMAYDAGGPASFNVETSFTSYRLIYAGMIYLGIELGAQSWGGYVTVQSDVDAALACVEKDGKAGIFIWSWFKDTTGSPSVSSVITQAKTVLLGGNQIPVVNNSPWKVMITCPACKYNLKLNYF